MTTEIAVFNANGIALAADSAVSTFQGRKVYNSANKLFTLSKTQPVAIMIYNSATILGVPWEVAIKEFRAYLGKESHASLKVYVDRFWEFIHEKSEWFPIESQLSAIQNKIYMQWEDVRNKLFNVAEIEGSADHVKEVLVHSIEQREAELARLPYLEDFSEADFQLLLVEHMDLFSETFRLVFEGSYDLLSDVEKEKLNALTAESLVKDEFNNYSGVVFAGYGTEEITPKITSFQVGIFANSKLRKKHLSEKCNIGKNFVPDIIPFAQDGAIWTFLTGIDPNIRDSISQVIQALPEIISGRIEDVWLSDNHSPSNISPRRLIIDELNTLATALMDELGNVSHRFGSKPIIEMLSMLPKDELAEMAETLVHLTAFKQRMTNAHSTVGGPIDVAIISKGDGFIWVKRKHYFKQELNPHFNRNYFEDLGDA